jgi:hypothetical protein
VTMTALYVMATLTSPAFGGLVDFTNSYAVAWMLVGVSVLGSIPLFSLAHSPQRERPAPSVPRAV